MPEQQSLVARILPYESYTVSIRKLFSLSGPLRLAFGLVGVQEDHFQLESDPPSFAVLDVLDSAINTG